MLHPLCWICNLQRHLDPSIIIQSPIPNETLIQLITYSMAWNILLIVTQRSKSCLHILPISIAGGSVFFYVLFIMCGFHPTFSPVQTFLASLHVAMNSIFLLSLDNPIKENENSNSSISKQQIWIYVFGPAQNDVQRLHQSTFYGSFVGMGSFSILRILDHGMQIQRHPVPILLGFTWGRFFGSAFGVLRELAHNILISNQ